VAGELEGRWNKALARVAEVESKIAAHDATEVAPATDPALLATLAADLKTVWNAPSTDTRLKKRIVRIAIHDVIADVDSEAAEIVLVVHWIGGVHSEIRLPRRRRGLRNSTSAESHRRHPEQERIGDGLWQSLDPRARHRAALASPHSRSSNPPMTESNRGCYRVVCCSARIRLWHEV
jgi:hypothetical protein